MKVSEVIKKLKEFNQEADVDIILGSNPYQIFEFYYGTSHGCTKKNCQSVSLSIPEFDDPETPEGKIRL